MSVEVLSETIVVLAVEFGHLRIPSAVVELTVSNLQRTSFPALDFVISAPSSMLARILESAVDNFIMPSSLLEKSDVINCQSI
jgi:hypothetical protein